MLDMQNSDQIASQPPYTDGQKSLMLHVCYCDVLTIQNLLPLVTEYKVISTSSLLFKPIETWLFGKAGPGNIIALNTPI
jgi:hypothetical protein